MRGELENIREVLPNEMPKHAERLSPWGWKHDYRTARLIQDAVTRLSNAQ